MVDEHMLTIGTQRIACKSVDGIVGTHLNEMWDECTEHIESSFGEGFGIVQCRMLVQEAQASIQVIEGRIDQFKSYHIYIQDA